MADELTDLLLGGMEAKRKRFASEDFAGGYGGSVVGRVKRRRLVSATAVGSGTAVAVGAVAFSAWQLPWVGSALVRPGGSSSVVCMTAGAEQGWASLASSDGGDQVADFSEWGVSATYDYGRLTIVDAQADGAITVVALDGTPAVIEEGGQAALRQHDEGTYTLPLPGDRVVTLRVVPYEPPAGADAITTEYLFPKVKITVGASATPTVTCVTSTPEPSDSESLSTSASPTPSVTPSAASTWDPAVVASQSPFQCGNELATEEHGTDQLHITRVKWLSPDQANAEIAAMYHNDDAPFHTVGDDDVAKFAVVDTRWPREGEELGMVNSDGNDPVPSAEHDMVRDLEGRAIVFVGTSFVAVRDGEVVGTFTGRLGEANEPIHLAPDATDFGAEAMFLNPDGAFTACGGGKLTGDWDLYAVAGQSITYSDGTAEVPIYAWKKIEPQG